MVAAAASYGKIGMNPISAASRNLFLRSLRITFFSRNNIFLRKNNVVTLPQLKKFRADPADLLRSISGYG